MAYDPITNITLAGLLAALHPGASDTPTDAEAANLLGKVDVQTRRFLYDYLATKFDTSTEKLKPGVVDDTSLVGKVKGSTSNAGTVQGIVQGTVSTPDLRDGAVSTVKLLDAAVTTAKVGALQITTALLADLGVTTGKINDLAVTTGKLAANAVDATKLANGAVGSTQLASSAVTGVKIAANAVTTDKLVAATNVADILLADGSKVWQSVALSGDITISSAGVVTIANNGIAIVREEASNTTAGGASVAGGATFTTPNVRGVAVGWVKQFETIPIVDTITSGKIQLRTGTYYIEVTCPAYSAGLHLCRLQHRDSGDTTDITAAAYGTSEVAQLGVQSASKLTAKFIVTSTSQFLRLQHWTELVKGTNGLGFPTSSGGSSEVYAVIKLQKIG